ncbi:MAG: 2-oxoacid:ferredoxin oxidoreductase subunit beta [Nitrospinota bacterium]|nr:2-oxoacid:ferredoxin oxidoreductase subunit beta [Nitrospinota bacterium]
MATQAKNNGIGLGLTRKDFQADQTVRWCPGCGDYAILAQIQKLLPELDIPRENFVFAGGIGCAARFPYYMDTYGFHTIHGRAPAFATGIKMMNPELSVWVISGDGDALSIGGNHLIHAMRRNVGIKILLFNNRIYGLTKGQYSPTSLAGSRTKSTPLGSVDHPLQPLSLAIGVECSFVARTIDRDQKHMASVLHAAANHEGTAFVEILQNCIVFNDGAWHQYTEKGMKEQNVIYLEDGKPLVFGPDGDKRGIRFRDFRSEIVPGDEEGISVHQENDPEGARSLLLSRLESDGGPMAIGVLRNVSRPALEDQVAEQVAAAQAKGEGSIEELLNGGDTWVHK